MAKQNNPLCGWRLDPALLRFHGHDLQRPECILAEPDGVIWTADARGIMRIRPDGEQTLIRLTETADRQLTADNAIAGGSLPNGIAFTKAGDIIIANFGTDVIELMTREGKSRTLFDNLDGQPFGKVNFVLTDRLGRIWFTVTTRQVPWTRSINEKTADGYVGIIDDKGPRIVADGFVGTNEIRLDDKEEWLYVVETNARRISRLRLRQDGSAYGRETYGPSDLGGFPDGFAFDAYGNLWIALILTERLIALTPDGEVITLLDDGNPQALAAYEDHYKNGTTTPALMDACKGRLAPMMASITFGGPDLQTVYLGSLLGTTLPCFQSPVAGQKLSHWS